ncbi:PIN domain-containing protein [Floridanema evergladense]|uniref:PIN domain-containing protein n=1 Tax=Floridaenema evergladense BLCC-F167 TaxID=3153639 RepID=A0ABV4WL04_9CYAN
MTYRVFLDTNLWIYFYAKEPIEKSQKIEEIISNNIQQIQVSVQILGELFHVLTRKKLTSQSDAASIVLELINNFSILEVDHPKVIQALQINSKYGYSYWDSLVIATALLSDCAILYSEDMQHNQLIENKIQIINPFTI